MARSLTWHCCPWCLTEDEKTAARIDQEINKILLEQKRRDRGELKLLLLGPGESGKSTFIKQMRIIHGAGFSEEDRKGFRPLVYQNIFASMRAMIEAMDQLQIPFSRPESKSHASLVMSQDPYKVTTFEKRYAVAMQWLWSDGGIRACYERRREFHLLDSAVYYLSHLERITEEGYIPTAQDVLRSRMPTTGINEYCFSVQKTNLRIVDVGGQRSERKKWIHCFENVIALIYLASLSEYDQCLEENNQEVRGRWGAIFSALLLPQARDPQLGRKPRATLERACVSGVALSLTFHSFVIRPLSPKTDSQALVLPTTLTCGTCARAHTDIHVLHVLRHWPPEAQHNLSWKCRHTAGTVSHFYSEMLNRMKESLALFGTILELPWFKSTSVILFLNKTDILEEKIPTSHLATYFPSFQGPKQDAEAAKRFILDMYSRMYAGCADAAADGGRKGSRSRRLFSHYTCATDTQNIRKVFKDVRDSVLARYLDEINLL